MAFVGPSGRILEVDGLRAVAVLTVIAYHFDLHLPGGLVGVDLFFVISGFVISRLLFTQAEGSQPTGQLLLQFFTRRAWRLVPALLATLLVTIAAGFLFPRGETRLLAINAVAAVGGFANWWVGATAPVQGQTDLSHTWSLSIEEQFYVMLPLLLMVRRTRATLTATVVSVGLVIAAIVAFATTSVNHESLNHTYFSSFARSTPLALGVLLGVAWHHGWLRPAPTDRPRTTSMLFVLLSVSMIPALLVLDWDTHWLYQGGFVMIAIVLTGMVAATIRMADGPQLAARALRSTPVQWVAARSYSLYLVHFTMVFRFASYGRIGTLVLQLLGTFVGTELLHRVVEEPLRRWGPATRHGSKILAGQATAAGAALVAIVGFGL